MTNLVRTLARSTRWWLAAAVCALSLAPPVAAQQVPGGGGWSPAAGAAGDNTYQGFIDQPADGATIQLGSTFHVSGWIVDRYDANRMIAAGYLFWSLATAATGIVRGFTMLLGMRLLLGIGESVMVPAYSKILSFHLPEHHHFFVQVILQCILHIPVAVRPRKNNNAEFHLLRFHAKIKCLALIIA